MKKTFAFIIFMIAAATSADQVIIVTNNINDLNPQRDTLQSEYGRGVRLTAILNDGVDPFNMTGASFPVYMTISHRTDNYTNAITTSIAGTASNNYLRWRFTLPDVGEYELQASAIFPTETIPVLHNYIVSTSAPSAAVINVSNAVDVVLGATYITNIYEAGSFPTYVSNYVDLAMYSNTYYVTNFYFPTGGVTSINGQTGAVTLAVSASTNDAGVASIAGLTLTVGTNFPEYLTRNSQLSAYATGTPLYAYTESDPVWTSASSLYYTASQADTLFATGAPLYEVDLSPYATGTPLYTFTESDPFFSAISNDLVKQSIINTIAGDNLYGNAGKLYVSARALSYGPIELNQFSGTLFQNSGYSTGLSSNSTPSAFGFYTVQTGSAVINPVRIFGVNKGYRIYAAFRSDGGFNDGLHAAIRISDNNGQSYFVSGLTDVYIGTATYVTHVSSQLNSGSVTDYAYRPEVYFAAYNGGNGATIQDTTIYLIGDL